MRRKSLAFHPRQVHMQQATFHLSSSLLLTAQSFDLSLT
jgi:hypothetical protein